MEIGQKQWIRASFYGWMLGFALIIVLAMVGEAIFPFPVQFIIGTGMGLGLSWLQVKQFRKHLNWGYQWIWITTAGMTLGFGIIEFISRKSPDLLSFSLLKCVLLGGAITTLFQYLYLKNKSDLASRWMPVSFVGWAQAAILAYGSDHINEILPRSPWSVIPFLLLTFFMPGYFYGLITWFGIKKLQSGSHK